jgi:peptidoglycan hydrolase CwlO-like protein
MSTTNYPSSNPQDQPPRNNAKNAVIALLAVAFIGSIGYAIYSNNHHQTIQQTQQTQISKVVDERGQLQRNFDDALVRLDSMSGISNKMQGILSDRQKDISKMKGEIRSILGKQRITEAEKKKAEALLAELNQKISNMEQEVARLTQDNQNLTQDKTVLTQDKEKLTSDLQTVSTEKEGLARKVDVASTLNASNIMITPVQDKKNGEEKVTTKAKKVDKLKITFDVTNRIALSGQTDVYVCITGPDGKMITTPGNGSGTFTTREEGDKLFTAMVPVEFEAGKDKLVEFSWKQESGFQTGTYKIEIYHNGFKIGEGTKELKKGGLFS